MHVYRPYIHPRRARALPPPLFTTANTVGAATVSMSASAQASAVVLGVGSAAVVVAAQAQQGDFTSSGSASASVEASAQASGVSIAANVANPATLQVSAQASGQGFNAGEGRANIAMSMSVQAVGTRIVPGQQPGAQVVDMQAFVERKVERAAEYRFSSGGHTRDFYQRGN